jgi:CHAD domain-containing protein
VPFFGKAAKGLAEQAEEVQELLGEHQDAVIASDVLRRMATAPKSGSFAFTLGLLYARQQEAIAHTRDEFPGRWAEASRAKHRKWLRG